MITFFTGVFIDFYLPKLLFSLYFKELVFMVGNYLISIRRLTLVTSPSVIRGKLRFLSL